MQQCATLIKGKETTTTFIIDVKLADNYRLLWVVGRQYQFWIGLDYKNYSIEIKLNHVFLIREFAKSIITQLNSNHPFNEMPLIHESKQYEIKKSLNFCEQIHRHKKRQNGKVSGFDFNGKKKVELLNCHVITIVMCLSSNLSKLETQHF